MNAKEVSRQLRRSASTITVERSLHANTATRRMFPSERLRCTYARTLCRVSAQCVGKLSAVRGYYKATFARTRGKNLISALNVNARLPIVQICERIYKRTLQ